MTMTINSPCMPRICISQSTYYYREDGDSAYFVAESARKKQQATTVSGPRESAWTRADQKTGSTLSWSLEQGCPFNLRSNCELFLRFQVSRCPVGVSLIVFRPQATDDSRLCCLDASEPGGTATRPDSRAWRSCMRAKAMQCSSLQMLRYCRQ